ncbi:MAG: class I SAM-dependent methyltransferase [Hyphomicrobiaceae bacterium]
MATQPGKAKTNPLKEFAKKIAFRHTNLFRPKYPYSIEPIQLSKIIASIDEVLADKDGKGCIVEIGVARGKTSRFIVEHIIKSGYDVDYYCIDTFSSFTDDDLQYEVENRGKRMVELQGFAYNDFETWKKNFKEFGFVKPIQADASAFDFSTIAPIDFCFLDVDLYIPTRNVMTSISEHMSQHSILMCDDVRDEGSWDGAYQAFMEHVRERDLAYEIFGTKCGFIRFPQ